MATGFSAPPRPLPLAPLPAASGPLLRAQPVSALDIASGVALGADVTASALRSLPRRGDPQAPREALERCLRACLSRPPCLVSFSGGRDSSALLALAVRVARRDGLALPIPATLRFIGASAADEQVWQHETVDHLGLADWLRIDIGTELNALGPVARTALHRHGLLWPFNTYVHLPIVAAAAGGTVVTGLGGDELGRASSALRAAQVLTRRRPLRPTDPLVVGLAYSPRPVRRAVHRRRARASVARLPWLTVHARRQLVRAMADAAASVPTSWDRTLRQWLPTGRYLTQARASFDALGAAHRVVVTHPFVEAPVLRALAASGGFAGPGSRTNLMAQLVGDLLPARTVARAGKAEFSDPIWSAEAMQFARAWDGDGADRDYVDVDALRALWRSGSVNPASTFLLQSLWLSANPPA